MWVELDKEQFFIDIVCGELDIDKESVRVVSFEDEGYVDSLDNVEVSAIRYLVESEDIKIFKKVIDAE
jgi:hypothetical protein